MGWRVGIATGDLAYNLDAPIIVATLETQKRALMTGKGPRLLCRRISNGRRPSSQDNYELALAMKPTIPSFSSSVAVYLIRSK